MCPISTLFILKVRPEVEKAKREPRGFFPSLESPRRWGRAKTGTGAGTEAGAPGTGGSCQVAKCLSISSAVPTCRPEQGLLGGARYFFPNSAASVHYTSRFACVRDYRRPWSPRDTVLDMQEKLRTHTHNVMIGKHYTKNTAMSWRSCRSSAHYIGTLHAFVFQNGVSQFKYAKELVNMQEDSLLSVLFENGQCMDAWL